MKKLIAAVISAIFVFALTAVSQAQSNDTAYNPDISAAKPSKTHIKRRKMAKKKRLELEKEKKHPSMFKKTLFDAPALQHR